MRGNPAELLACNWQKVLDRSRIGLIPVPHVCRSCTEPEFTASLPAASRLPAGRQGQEPNLGQPVALAVGQDRPAAPRAARRGAERHRRGTDDAAQPPPWACRRSARYRPQDRPGSSTGRRPGTRAAGRPGSGNDPRARHRSRLEAGHRAATRRQPHRLVRCWTCRRSASRTSTPRSIGCSASNPASRAASHNAI